MMTYFQMFELTMRFLAIMLGMSLNMRRIMKSEGRTIDDILFVSSVVLGLALGFVWRRYEK